MKRVRMVLVTFGLVVACSTASSGTAPVSATVAPPKPGEWERWSHDEKLTYMKAAVLKKEKQIFAEFDPIKYAAMTCETCHGGGAKSGTFKMPNPDLPKWPGGAEAFKALKAKDPKMLYFMQQVVGPKTADLLAVKPFDMASHTGFSCFHCHVRGEWNGIPPVSGEKGGSPVEGHLEH